MRIIYAVIVLGLVNLYAIPAWAADSGPAGGSNHAAGDRTPTAGDRRFGSGNFDLPISIAATVTVQQFRGTHGRSTVWQLDRSHFSHALPGGRKASRASFDRQGQSFC